MEQSLSDVRPYARHEMITAANGQRLSIAGTGSIYIITLEHQPISNAVPILCPDNQNQKYSNNYTITQSQIYAIRLSRAQPKPEIFQHLHQ